MTLQKCLDKVCLSDWSCIAMWTCHLLFLVKWLLLEHISQFYISHTITLLTVPLSPANCCHNACSITWGFAMNTISCFPSLDHTLNVFLFLTHFFKEFLLFCIFAHIYHLTRGNKNVNLYVWHRWWLNSKTCFSFCNGVLATFSFAKLPLSGLFLGLLKMLWNVFRLSAAFVWGNHVVGVEI